MHSYKIQQVRDKAVQKGHVEPHRTDDLPSEVWLAKGVHSGKGKDPPCSRS